MISDDEKLLKERLRYVVQVKKTKMSELGRNDSERVMAGRQIGENDTTVPYRTLFRVLSMYPDISAEWLILGTGSMYKADRIAPVFNNEVHNSRAGGSISIGTSAMTDSVQQLLEEKNARIAELEKDKALLQTLLAAMTQK